MFDNQITALATILRDTDIHKYAGDAFWNIIKAVALGDIDALLESATETKNLLFHAPTVLFWDKMSRYMFGTFKNYGDQVKLAEKFYDDNVKYKKFVKKQIHLINELNDDMKIDYYAQLTRCFLLNEMEPALYYKLARFLVICTPEELEYIASFNCNGKTKLSAMVSSLYQYGLFDQAENYSGSVDYVLSGFAKALKVDCLNYDEGCCSDDRILYYSQITPLGIPEPMSWGDIDKIVNDNN